MFRWDALLKILNWLLARGLLEVSSFCKGSSFSCLTGECIEHAQMGLSPRRAHWGQNESSWRGVSRVSSERLGKVKARLRTENGHGGRQPVLLRSLDMEKGPSLSFDDAYLLSVWPNDVSATKPYDSIWLQLTLNSWSLCALVSKGNKAHTVRTSLWICADEMQYFL